MPAIDIAIRVLRDEAAAIEEIIRQLDDSFNQAIDLILSAKGRVILSGMGKSGHVARKVAATMASTGTPAFFLHPAEAIHGDLGMATKHDVIIAYSNSGETAEILHMIPSIKRIGTSLIAVTGKIESTLAQNADISLNSHVNKEADSLGLAPTNSTTAALALGDALAVALMEMRHFTSDNFAVFHPGGSLGKKLLLTVDMIMHKGHDNPIINKDASVKNALFIMTDKGLGAVSVVDENKKLLGILTDGDIRRAIEKGIDFLQCPVEKVMTASPRVIFPSQLATEALRIMETHTPRPITVLPVTDEENQVIGMIHITDLLKRGIV